MSSDDDDWKGDDFFQQQRRKRLKIAATVVGIAVALALVVVFFPEPPTPEELVDPYREAATEQLERIRAAVEVASRHSAESGESRWSPVGLDVVDSAWSRGDTLVVDLAHLTRDHGEGCLVDPYPPLRTIRDWLSFGYLENREFPSADDMGRALERFSALRYAIVVTVDACALPSPADPRPGHFGGHAHLVRLADNTRLGGFAFQAREPELEAAACEEMRMVERSGGQVDLESTDELRNACHQVALGDAVLRAFRAGLRSIESAAR